MNRETLRDVVALWLIDEGPAEDIVRTACDLLVAGVDGLAMCELAAVPYASAAEEVPPLLAAALTEVGLPHHQRGSTEADVAGLVVLCRRVLANLEQPRRLTSWAHVNFGHDGPDVAQGLVNLDDAYDCAHDYGAPYAEVDADVLAEARRIVSG